MPRHSTLLNLFPKLVIFTNFLGSFLLFLVQPLIGKFLLPYFGGSSVVWIVSVAFFTTALFLGYLYVFFLTKLSFKKELIVHFLFLLILVGFHFFNFFSRDWLTFIFPDNLALAGTSINYVIQTLILSVGLLFVILATTDTLLQSWYGRVTKGKSPYFLYSISNLACILGLFSYPLFFEVVFGNLDQSIVWSGLFGVYLLAFFLVILVSYLLTKDSDAEVPLTSINPGTPLSPNISKSKKEQLKPLLIAQWFFYSAVPVMTFLVITESLTKGVSSFPLIWILPLFSYLLSFVVAFRVEVKPLLSVLVFACLFLITGTVTSIFDHVFLINVMYSNLLVLITGLICHGILYQQRPRNLNWLATFYLLISLGGALGGIFISLLVPVFFNNNYEFYLILFLILVVCSKIVFDQQNNAVFSNKTKGLLSDKNINLFALVMVGVNLVLIANGAVMMLKADAVRNHFGTLTTRLNYWQDPDNQDNFYLLKTLMHGSISHGHEALGYQSSGKSSYYSEISGYGLSVNYLQQEKDSLNIAAIGLGAGMISVYNREDDRIVFYEINPLIEQLAKEEFSYLDNALGEVEVRLGDARLVLEQELQNNPQEKFELLMIDAFSDNTIPVHLLTKEAFDLYHQKTVTDGIIAYHISNRYLDLEKILVSFCNEISADCILVKNRSVPELNIQPSTYLIISKNQGFADYLGQLDDDKIEVNINEEITQQRLNYWTDDKNYFFSVFRIL